MPKREITDHKGEVFESLRALCKRYEISESLFNKRMSLGWPMESILTKGKWEYRAVGNSGKLIDFKGTSFNTLKSMLEFYGVNKSTYTKRLRAGWSLEAALTGEYGYTEFYDHFGIYHKSRSACAVYYGVDDRAFIGRVGRGGCTVREAIAAEKYQTSKGVYDVSLNPLIAIHEYSHIQEWTNQRVFRCTILSTNDTMYLIEDQVKAYKE